MSEIAAITKPPARQRDHKVFGVLASLGGSLTAIAIALLIASVVLQLSGFGGLSLVRSLAKAVGPNIDETLRWTTPLILTGLGTAVVFRARIWNIGLDGQIYVGALCSAVFARFVSDSMGADVGVIVILVASIVGGALFAAIPAILRILWNAPEIVTTVILISVGQLLVSYAVRGPLQSADPARAAASATDPIDRQLWLAKLYPGSAATVGIFVALGAVVVIALYLKKSRLGLDLRMYGANARFSHYIGIDNRRVFLTAMLISGALGGLAGGIQVLGVFHSLVDRFNPGMGFTGIAVALVAKLSPLAVVLSAFFFGALQVSGSNLQLATDAPSQFVDIVTGVVVLIMTSKMLGLSPRRLVSTAKSRLKRLARGKRVALPATKSEG